MSREQPRDDYAPWSQRMHHPGVPPNMNRFAPGHGEFMPPLQRPVPAPQERGFAPGSFGNSYQSLGYGAPVPMPAVAGFPDYYVAIGSTGSSPTSHHYPGMGNQPYPQARFADGGYNAGPQQGVLSPTLPGFAARNTLWMGNLEPWMDEEYIKQACSMFTWHPSEIRVPRPTEGEAGQPLPNNTGYCFISFATAGEAAAALARVNTTGVTPMMPNSQRPFTVEWADCVPATTLMHQQAMTNTTATTAPKSSPEYSIFVGDLAPEATNSDLVAVFRNPILGLREDRRPKHVQPFHSCKSAKIMLDPVTGVSKGYGFVRFTDESDQQRALVEMHGLYCLSRPMRISPATAKNKAPGLPGIPGSTAGGSSSRSSSGLTSPGLPGLGPTRAAAILPQRPSPKPTPPPVMTSVTAPIAQAHGVLPGREAEVIPPAPAQQRNLYENIIGPNGEQLTSSDPYNTTVFVGGLSPLIGEDTLKSFFAPFGEIHYVKVPVGKHCGFVQFVRKSDAERAIEAMNGYPIGGSRIRLSWGRSQFKAVQAAAQQARANSLTNYFQAQAEDQQVRSQTQAQVHALAAQVQAGTSAAAAQRIQWQARSITPPTVAEWSGRSLSPRQAADIITLLHSKGVDVQEGNVADALRRFLDSGSPSTASPAANEAAFAPEVYARAQFSPDPMGQNRGAAATFQNGVIQRPTAEAPRDGTANAGLGASIWSSNSSPATLNRPPRAEEHDLIQDLNGTLASLGIDNQGAAADRT